MRREPPQRLGDYGPLFFPAGMLTLFFVVPFATMIAVSFFQREQGGFYTPAFVLDNYARFLSLFFGKVLGFSLFLAVAVAIACVVVGVPFTYLLARSARKTQIAWLVAAMWSSLNAVARDDPRCPDVPNATRCPGSAGSGCRA